MDFLDLKHLDGSTRSNRSIQGNKSERRSRLWMRLLQYPARVPKHLAIHIVHSQAGQRFNDLHGIGKTRDSLSAFPRGDRSLAHFRYRCKLLLRQTEVTANCMNVVANIVQSGLLRVPMVLMVLRERRFLRWEEDREQKNGSDSSQIRSASIDDLSKRDDLSCKRKRAPGKPDALTN